MHHAGSRSYLSKGLGGAGGELSLKGVFFFYIYNAENALSHTGGKLLTLPAVPKLQQLEGRQFDTTAQLNILPLQSL